MAKLKLSKMQLTGRVSTRASEEGSC